MRPANEGFKVKSKIDFMEITETHQLSGTPKKRMENPLRRTLIYFLHIKRKIVLSHFSMSLLYFFGGFSLLRVLQLRAGGKRIISEGN